MAKKFNLQNPPVAVIIDFGKSRRINDPKTYHAVKCNPEPRRRWKAPEVYDRRTGRQTVQPDTLRELTRFKAKRRSIDNLKSIIDQFTKCAPSSQTRSECCQKMFENVYVTQ